MGNLVRFDKQARLIPAQSGAKGEGQVLMFTGVRYERMPEKLSTKNRPNNKRKRKRG